MFVEKKLKEGCVLEQKIRKLEEYAEELGIVISYNTAGLNFSFSKDNQMVIKKDNQDNLLLSNLAFYYLDADTLEPSPTFPSVCETVIGIYTK